MLESLKNCYAELDARVGTHAAKAERSTGFSREYHLGLADGYDMAATMIGDIIDRLEFHVEEKGPATGADLARTAKRFDEIFTIASEV